MSDGFVDKIEEETEEYAIKYIEKLVKNVIKKYKWHKAIKDACYITEEMDDSFQEYILKSPSVQRHFIWLARNKSLEQVYRSFVITIAFELCANGKNEIIEIAESLGTAILDNWFELNKVDSLNYKREMYKNDIKSIIADRKLLYKEYFSLYIDEFSNDIIRVFYPKNGQGWVNEDKNYSVDIKVNLSKGTEFGFCRRGFIYKKIKKDGEEKYLKGAFCSKSKEIFRFNSLDPRQINNGKILWMQ